jgi:hypothetical protein
VKRTLFGIPIAAALCAVVFLGLASPAGAVLPTKYSNGFETDTTSWFDNNGTIARVTDPYTNPGGYASGTPSAAGTHHARLARGTCEIQNSGAGGGDTAYCKGPFTQWGGYGDIWPVGGYTTQVDIYLDATYAGENADTYGGNFGCLTASGGPTNTDCKGTRFDYTSAPNKNDGSGEAVRDFGFNVSTGLAGDNCDGFMVSAQTVVNRINANPNIPGTGTCIPGGWYTFKHTFSDNGGFLSVLMEIIPVGGDTPTASWTINSGDPISTVGCNRYGWFSNQEIIGLPIDNALMTGVCGTPLIPGKISPTGTTCQQYAAGTAPVLGQLQYTTTKGTPPPPLLNAVSPGVFFYYANVSGTEGQKVEITQTDNSTAPAIPIQNGQVVLYDASTCKVLKWTLDKVNDPVGTATGYLPSSGNFIIGVKYNSSALKGGTVPDPSPATYSFGTKLGGVAIPSETATIVLVKK